MALSNIISSVGGKKIGITKNILDVAVYKTAFFAVAYDFPNGSWVSLSSTSIPVLISVLRMKNAFKKPAVATATKLLNAFRYTSLLPVDLAVYFSRILRTPRPTQIAELVAIPYDTPMSCIV